MVLKRIEKECRQIVEIPGFMLRKPLEVVVSEEGGKCVATHLLPSLSEKGYMLSGIGETEEAAGDVLAKLISTAYSALSAQKPEQLGEELRLQRQYLLSIMEPYKPETAPESPERPKEPHNEREHFQKSY